MTQVAVLMTCHNRREKTLFCLDTLAAQVLPEGVETTVVLVDDASTDRTAEAVTSTHPQIRIVEGTGALYWTGGMHLAMSVAHGKGFDFYVWLNDDSQLYPDAIARLLAVHAELVTRSLQEPIVVGSLRDPGSGELAYGGAVRASRWHPLRFKRLPPSLEPVPCDVFNGNLVLFSHAVLERVGFLHPKLVHAAGDYEYALRARDHGFRAWIAPGYLGECPRNATDGTWVDTSLPLAVRYRKLFEIKGEPPRPRLVYYARHGGPFWWALYPWVYARPLFATLQRLWTQPRPSALPRRK